MKIKINIYICSLLLFAFVAKAQNIEWVENKGQWNSLVKFQGRLSNGAVFLERNGYKVLQHDSGSLRKMYERFHGSHQGSNISSGTAAEDDIMKSHAYEVRFNQSNPNVSIVPENPQTAFNNYFTGNDPKKWASGCKIFSAATYKNMYAGVDVRYYTGSGHMKYDIVVHPHADLAKLALDYTGVDGMETKGGELIVHTSIGEIKEKAPYSYQVVEGVRTQVACAFRVEGNRLFYELGPYDHNRTLVIDPTLVFASFTGSVSDNWGCTTTYGPGGVTYGAGIVFGSGFPVSTGAYQYLFGGGPNTGEAYGYDIGIIKLSADGNQRLYATLVGGNGNEIPESMSVDAQGNLVVLGRTVSGNFPLTTPILGAGGGWDIILFKLNPDGSALLGSMRMGGADNDGVNIRNKYPTPQPSSLMLNYNDDNRSDFVFDASGNILVASCSKSTNFPVTANAYQPTNNGSQDALFLKVNPSLSSLLYASYLGGTSEDAAYTLAISPQTGEVWMCGGTASANFPGNKTGVLSPSANGNIDGFVAVLSTAGVLLKSSYIGTSGNDQVYALKIDKNGFPYIMGTTTGSFPVLNAAFSQTGGKQFIAKLQKSLGGYVYSTVFGTNAAYSNISPTAFTVDDCENVYVAGWGGSITSSIYPQFPNAGTTGLTVTSNAIKAVTDGADFYLFVMEKNATSQLYGSFFGQTGGAADHSDAANSKFDDNGSLYLAICANCGATPTNFPVTPGAWSIANNSGGGCNQAMVKIKFDFANVRAGLKSSIISDGDTVGCSLPFTVAFRDTIATATNYQWNFDDGTATVATTTPSSSHTYVNAGTYRVRLIAIDNARCIPRDTSYVNITSGTTTDLGADVIIYQNCPGEISNLVALYNTTGLAANWNTPVPSAAPLGNYQLIAANNYGCKDTAFAAVILEVAVWTGATSTNWHTATNWNINKVPFGKTHVIVPGNTPNTCVVSDADAQAASIQLRNGATVQTVNNRQVVINGQCLTLPPG